jgi:hypothetical protein
MKKLAIAIAGLLAGGLVQADKLDGVTEMICAPAQAHICIENDTCYAVTPAELGIPNFVVIDTKKKTISTTKSSYQNRTTPFTSVTRNEGLIYLHGIEGERSFSFVIEEETGRMTVAVAHDGMSVSVFGACTDTDL